MKKGNGRKPKKESPLKSPKIHHMRVKKGRNRFLAFNPAVRDEFVIRNKRVLLSTYKLIVENLEILSQGQIIADKKAGIEIEKAATGSYKGAIHYTTLRVKANGREFFVKVSLWREGESLLAAVHKVDRYLKQVGHKIDGFHIKVIKPHIIYDDPNVKRTFLATNFYNPGEVVQVWDLKGADYAKVNAPLEKLRKALMDDAPEGQKIKGIGSRNAFYHAKTNTILLFDLTH